MALALVERMIVIAGHGETLHLAPRFGKVEAQYTRSFDETPQRRQRKDKY